MKNRLLLVVGVAAVLLLVLSMAKTVSELKSPEKCAV